jgi:DNA excision repair protein ERCC-2
MGSEEGSRESVDAGCRRLTASWVRERAARDPEVETCDFFEQHEAAGHEALLPPGMCVGGGGGDGERGRGAWWKGWQEGRVGGMVTVLRGVV